MGERMFWIDETEDGSEEFESSHGSDDSSSSKKLRFSPHHLPTPQEGRICAETSPEGSSSSPLGLTLTKTPSFLSLLRNNLSKGKSHQQHYSHSPKPKSADHHDSKSQSEKLKASNFPAMMLQIGSWQRIGRHQGELVAKLYYAKRKLVWEVLDRALKSKIEMQWSDIIAIRAVLPDDDQQPGTLQIELNRPPLFYRESNPQPRKHTLWHQTNDFTGGQAPMFRRHYVRFPPGVLDRHYHKLLQCDERLYALSRKPFPSCESPYFDWNMGRVPQLSLNFTGSGFSPHAQYPYGAAYPVTARPPPSSSLGLIPNSTFPGMGLAHGDGGRSNHYANQEEMNWGNLNHQGMPQLIPSGSSQAAGFHYQNPQPNVGLLPALSSADGTLNAAVGPAAYAFMESTPANPNNYNAYHQYMGNDATPLADYCPYSNNANWPFASQDSAGGTHEDQNADNSPLPPYPGISNNLGGYFNF